MRLQQSDVQAWSNEFITNHAILLGKVWEEVWELKRV